jgi:hypothetical protein
MHMRLGLLMQYDRDGYGDDGGDGAGGGDVEAFRQVGWHVNVNALTDLELSIGQSFHKLRVFYLPKASCGKRYTSPKRGSLKRGSLKHALKQARKQALRRALKRALKRILIDSIHSVYSTSDTCQPIVKTG